MSDPAVIGQEIVRRVFGRHAALHGKARRADRVLTGQADLRIGERHALRDQDLRLLTRSMPVTSSVTVCSTWIRGLTSMK